MRVPLRAWTSLSPISATSHALWSYESSAAMRLVLIAVDAWRELQEMYRVTLSWDGSRIVAASTSAPLF